MSLRNWSVGVWLDLSFVCHCVRVCVRSSVCSCGIYGLWSSRLVDERGALHCSISSQPQTITHYCPAVSMPFPPTAASLFPPVPHWAVVFSAHCLCRRNGTIKWESLPLGAPDCWCTWPSDELVEKMFRIGHQTLWRMWARSGPTEPDGSRPHRGNYSAARVVGYEALVGDSHCRPASTLFDFPRKCLFLSLPRWEVSPLLISSLFIKGAPEESKHTIRFEGSWSVGRK